MRVRRAPALLLLAGLAVCSPATAAEPPQLAVALTPERVTVGSRVTAVLTVTVPAAHLAGEPRFPAWSSHWGPAEIFAIEAPERLAASEGVAIFRQRLVLAAFRPGAVPLPPATVTVPLAAGRVELTTPQELSLDIVSVLPPLPDDPGAEPVELTRRPEAPPRTLPMGRRFGWTAAALSAGCLTLGLLLWRRSRLGVAAAAPPAPPLAELETELDRLGAAVAGAEGFVLLSWALRRYLGRQLEFPAPESTSAEVRAALAAHALPEDLCERLAGVLAACDLVKFARQPAEAEALRRHGRTAREIGRELDLHLNPQPAAGASGEAA